MQQGESENINRRLQREVLLPTASGPSRPCMLVGLSLVALCLAASLDAFLWQQSRDAEESEVRNVELRIQAASFAAEAVRARAIAAKARADARKTRMEMAALAKDMQAAQDALDKADSDAGRVNARHRLREMKQRMGDYPTREQIRRVRLKCAQLNMKCEHRQPVWR